MDFRTNHIPHNLTVASVCWPFQHTERDQSHVYGNPRRTRSWVMISRQRGKRETFRHF